MNLLQSLHPNAAHAAAPLSMLLRALPGPLHDRVVSSIGNFMLRGQPFAADLTDLEGRRIALRVTDTGRELHFQIQRGRVMPSATGAFDVRISGNTIDLLKLALREDDPDTLFFDRRMCLEGDTETGLLLKNLLDAIEFDAAAHARAVLGDTLGSRVADLIRRAGELQRDKVTERTRRAV